MGKNWCYFLFMLWFTYLIVSSILLFSRGFLLTKNSQFTNSTCLTLAEIPCLDPQDSTIVRNGHQEQCSNNEKLLNALNNINSASSICLPQQSRIIVMIVDALRYDFILYDEKLNKPLPFQNKLPILAKLLKQYPDSSRSYQFIADPPTTTMQRIKGLTTGSLPTFIDAGSNFATNEINEDNIIDQLRRNNKSVVFMGDDTWEGLFPNRFTRQYPSPSFNVWDLDTVDTSNNNYLFHELNQTDWSLLIAHYLGVDHCGHRYGPFHAEMERKLTEINNVIEKVVDTMDSNTILMVMGDHGMTVTGDHGGESDDETMAALFVHAKTPFFTHNPNLRKVRQVNLVPTLATILGVSIPYSNLGSIILDILPSFNYSKVEEWQIPLFYLWANVLQIWNYVDDYSKSYPSTFDSATIKLYREKFSVLNSKLHSVMDYETFEYFHREATEFMVKMRESCEAIWIQYDSFSMTRGLLFLFLSMFFVFTITDGIPAERLPEIFMSSFLYCCYSAMFMAVLLSLALYYFDIVSNLISTIFFSTGLVSQLMLAMLVIQNWELITLNWYDRSKKQKISNIICRFVLIFNICGVFSNSFIIEEASVLLFLLCTVILVGVLTVSQGEIKKKDLKSKLKLIGIAIGIMMLLRFSVYFWRCRDRDDQPWCYELQTAFTSSKAETTKVEWILTVISLAVFVTITKVWLRNCGNLNGFALPVTFLRYVPTVLVVFTSGYWVLNRLPVDKKSATVTKLWQTNVLAWIVYGLASLGIVLTVLKPLYIYILPSNRNDVSEEGNIIPQLYKKVKKMFNEKKEDAKESDDVPIICGLATVYSCVFITIGIYLTHLFALLQGDATAPATVVMFLASAFVLIVTSVMRLEKANTIDDLLEIPNMSVLVWVILTQYFFYGTGHQATFSNIVWDAAFVGTSGVFHLTFIPAGLVVISTFCSQILMGFLLPLLVIMPFTISVMYPSIVRKSLFSKDNLRGEVLLYERDGLMTTVVFTTICKYLMCQGLRVFASMLAATIHCRHMMVWKIFAPKMIFEALGMFITLASVNISFLVLMRVNRKVDNLIVSLTKRHT